MPVRWTAENDHLLLLTLLETHQIKVDGEKIRTAWPEKAGEKPTARAIKERIVKIKSLTSPSRSPAGDRSHVNNGIKKESSPKKNKILGKRGSFKGSFSTEDKLENEGLDAVGTPCPSPRAKRAIVIKNEHEQKQEVESFSTEEDEPTYTDFDDTADDDEWHGD